MQRPDGSGEAEVAAELRRLNARVEQLERAIAVLQAGGAAAPSIVAPAPPPPPMPVRPAPPAAETPVPSMSAASPLSQEPVVSPSMPAMEAAAAPSYASRQEPRREAASSSLENRLGAQIFNRIGILALLCAAALGLKLAIDNQWIGPVGRILIGLVAGAGVIVWSERFRCKGFALFSYSLKAIGTGVLYLTLWAAFQIYSLVPASTALVGMMLVTAWNAYMAWVQNAQVLAAYALAGGLSTPLLLSTGGDHEFFLFSYLLVIDLATVMLVRLRSWSRLLLAAFPATVIYFAGWFIYFYKEPAFAETTIFLCLFFVVFLIPSLQKEPKEELEQAHRRPDVLRAMLLPLGNAAFISLALCATLQQSERHWFLPWLMLLLSAAYLLVTRLPQGVVTSAVHLSLAVVFLTIAVPLKASGHWITVTWLVEGVALLWASSRVLAGAASEQHRSAAATLRWLAAGSLVLGLGALIGNDFWFRDGAEPANFDHHAMTALVGAAAFGLSAWLSLRGRSRESAGERSLVRFALASMVAICAIAALLSLREIIGLGDGAQPAIAFLHTDCGMAVAGIALLAGVARASVLLARSADAQPFWVPLAAASVIAINLIAVLTGVREVRALWPVDVAGNSHELQRALAASSFLMLYGAALLAVGFWRRSAFVRWQALLLLIVSIAKTFLYDTRDLSQGYRFISFLILGALLMAISFAYQKDWLALRDHGDAVEKQEAAE